MVPVAPKVKGFVSNIYVFLTLIYPVLGFLIVANTVSLILIEEGFSVMLIPLVIFLLGFFIGGFFIGLYRIAPVAYKRFSLSEEGVSFGGRSLKWSEIESINIKCGFVKIWYGHSLFKKSFWMGSYDEIPVEDIICINCDFSTFRGKAAKNCIYIPRNAKTEQVMQEYCPNYAAVADERDKNPYLPKILRRDTFPGLILITGLCVMVCALMISGGISVMGAVLYAVFFFCAWSCTHFIIELSTFFRKMILKSLNKPR